MATRKFVATIAALTILGATIGVGTIQADEQHAATAALSEMDGMHARPDKRKCGVLPGSGYVNYVITHNVSCREAFKVGNRAGRKFCAHSDRCSTSPDRVVEGRVRAKDWDCKVKVGYELFQARCRKSEMSFLRQTGA